MVNSKAGRSQQILIFCLVVLVTLVFAAFTDHRWEDWYITFKASKNLAMGYGLVYTPGERIHSFTSPIGTLIPALLSFIARNDEAVIWLFRILNALMLGVTAIFLYKITDRLKFQRLSLLLLIGLFATNILIIDYSINGMETAYMMFSIAYIIYVLFTATQFEQFYIKLALGLAAIMITRPDGWVYAGAIMTGTLLFPGELKRGTLVMQYFKAILLAMVLYAPWLFWTWSYYGTPIPHTLTAKAHALSIRDIISGTGEFIMHPTATIKGAFMPPYCVTGGWANLTTGSAILSALAMLPLIFPKIHSKTRILAFAAASIHFYLNVISGKGASPWYLPNLTIITILSLCLFFDQLYSAGLKQHKSMLLRSFAVLAFGFSFMVFCMGAHQVKTQYNTIEQGNRKQVGLWLKENAAGQRQTVFVECLGYIGYYSGLKMYDFPGLSSDEVVKVRKQNHSESWALIIQSLSPDWVILRPFEVQRVNEAIPGLLSNGYVLTRVFDVRDKVNQKDPFLWSGVLMYDAVFCVYKKI